MLVSKSGKQGSRYEQIINWLDDAEFEGVIAF
jgi:hypothetical protein